MRRQERIALAAGGVRSTGRATALRVDVGELI